MKNPNDSLGSQMHDFLACNTLVQLAVPLHTLLCMVYIKQVKEHLLKPLNGKKINVGINL
jgi:hypothetical protein